MTGLNIAAVVAWLVLGGLLIHAIWLRIKLNRKVRKLRRRVEDLIRVRNAPDEATYTGEQDDAPERDSLALMQLRRALDEATSRNPSAYVMRHLIDELLAWPSEQRGNAAMMAMAFLQELRITGDAQIAGTHHFKNGKWSTKISRDGR